MQKRYIFLIALFALLAVLVGTYYYLDNKNDKLTTDPNTLLSTTTTEAGDQKQVYGSGLEIVDSNDYFVATFTKDDTRITVVYTDNGGATYTTRPITSPEGKAQIYSISPDVVAGAETECKPAVTAHCRLAVYNKEIEKIDKILAQ